MEFVFKGKEFFNNMFYKSTRNKNVSVSSCEAITQGISVDGGLFVPSNFEKISTEEIVRLSKMSYPNQAKLILSKFLTDFSEQEISFCCENAYSTKSFDSEQIINIKKLNKDAFVLELWHGKTSAFKDMALQILPFLLTTASKKVVADKKIVILVATSGDTGKAALEGFADVENTEIIVFYPQDGVSSMQKRQMATQEGKNVEVIAINGNFDDAQTGVKEIFSNELIKQALEKKGKMFSSANSINWGRLVPQIVYYVSTYARLVAENEIKNGEQINVVVPTGNFGNILAAYYAKKMGLPLNKLICASNKNNILTDFIKTGVYDRNRSFNATNSPSMDILISSNLERLLFDLTDNDDDIINNWMNDLKENGKYEVSSSVKQKLDQLFVGGYCNDEQTLLTIKETFEKYNYLCDTHTAVALNVFEQYQKASNDQTKTIIASTASPYKFGNSVALALDIDESLDEYEQISLINKKTGLEIPEEFIKLKEKKIRFDKTVNVNQMSEAVLEII